MKIPTPLTPISILTIFMHSSLITAKPCATSNTSTTNPSPSPTTTIISSSTLISVSRAGGILNPSAAAEANPVDSTATRAFTSITIKSSSNQCLTIDPQAGDFRENIIPITLTSCNGDPGQNFDIVTSGKHNNQPGTMLVVSTLTQGCLNFDPRRAVGDTVIMFSCGGRADGGGSVTNSQLFAFNSSSTTLALVPENGNGQTCLVINAGKLDSAACDDGNDQLFKVG